MRIRFAAVLLGLIALGYGLSALSDARSNLALAQRLREDGTRASVATQVYLQGGTTKSGAQYLTVAAARAAVLPYGGRAPDDGSGRDDQMEPRTAEDPSWQWTFGWVPMTGIDEADDLPYDASLDGHWVPSRIEYGYASPTPVLWRPTSDLSAEVMAQSDVPRWDSPEPTLAAVGFMVAGLASLGVAAALVRGDVRRLRRRRADERRRLEEERAQRGPQDAVLPGPQDAPLTLWERRRSRSPYEGRHRRSLPTGLERR